MAMSDYLEDILLEMVLNSVVYSEPAAVYISLHTGSPADANDGANEVSTGGGSLYARQASGVWTVSGVATKATNAAEVTFPVAGASWGTVSHIGIYDAATTGNLLFHGALTASKVVNVDDQVEFPIASLGVTLD